MHRRLDVVTPGLWNGLLTDILAVFIQVSLAIAAFILFQLCSALISPRELCFSEFMPPLRRRNIRIFAVSVLRCDDILTLEGNY